MSTLETTSYDLMGFVFDHNRAFGILSNPETRYIEERGFFLNFTGVGQLSATAREARDTEAVP